METYGNTTCTLLDVSNEISLPDLTGVMNDSLAWLMEQAREETPTHEARGRLSALQSRHPLVDIDLVWEQEDYSGAIHYDLLIRPNEQGTISLSFCPDRAVPWPLRNAFRSPDGWVVRVNGRVIETPTLMTALDVIWGKTDLVRDIINLGLVQEAVTRRGLTVSPSELQDSMDLFRRKNRLLRKEEMLQYLNEHGISQEKLEESLEWELLEDKLRDDVTEGGIEQFFEQHRSDFEVARVARFHVQNEAHAHRIAAEIEAGQTSFLEAARVRFLDQGTAGSTFAVLRKGALTAVQAEHVFAATPGRIVVVPSGEGFDIVEVLRIDAAILGDATRPKVPRQKNGWAG